MKIKVLAFPLFTIILLSCNNSNSANSQSQVEEFVNETPSSLTKDSDYSLSSFSKRGQNILDKLYDEALEKNAKLKQLNDQLDKLEEFKNDSLASYLKFTKNNNNYWSSAHNYIHQIQDSTLKLATQKKFQNLESTYRLGIKKHEEKLNLIHKRIAQLSDQIILLKLVVTEQMIRNYQTNEQPNLISLESIINEQDKLLEQTKNYIHNPNQ